MIKQYRDVLIAIACILVFFSLILLLTRSKEIALVEKQTTDSINNAANLKDTSSMVVRAHDYVADSLAVVKSKDSLHQVEAIAYEGIKFGMDHAQTNAALKRVSRKIGKYSIQIIPSYVDGKLYMLDLVGENYNADYLNGYLHDQLMFFADVIANKYGSSTEYWGVHSISDLNAGKISYDRGWTIGDKRILTGMAQTYESEFYVTIRIYSEYLNGINDRKEERQKNNKSEQAAAKF